MDRNAPVQITVVSNTGPLLSAFQCSRTDFFSRYFRRIYIPVSEVEEFKRHGAGDWLQGLVEEGLVAIEHLTAVEAMRAEQIARHIAASPLSKVRDHRHHLPEAEAMVLAQREGLGVSRILLEERAARQVAQQLGLRLTGFVGVLLMACDEQLLTPAEMRVLLGTCRKQGTRYSDDLINEVCRQCEELRK
jgi:predicted nucleic acid-binding protein